MFERICFAAALKRYLRVINKRATRAENEDRIIRYKYLV